MNFSPCWHPKKALLLYFALIAHPLLLHSRHIFLELSPPWGRLRPLQLFFFGLVEELIYKQDHPVATLWSETGWGSENIEKALQMFSNFYFIFLFTGIFTWQTHTTWMRTGSRENRRSFNKPSITSWGGVESRGGISSDGQIWEWSLIEWRGRAQGKDRLASAFPLHSQAQPLLLQLVKNIDLWRCSTEVHMQPDRKLWIVYTVRAWLVVCVCVRALCVDPVDDLFGLVNLALNQQQLW